MSTTTTTTTTTKKTTVSAPGKILLAGGYLVLESPNVGLVVAADKRFYTEIKEEFTSFTSSSHDDPCISILVKSPQFHTQWEYTYQDKQLIPLTTNASFNPFVEKTLRLVFLYLQPHYEHHHHDNQGKSNNNNSNVSRRKAFEITIRADNDFYSILPHLSGENDDGAGTGAGARTKPRTRTPAAVAELGKFLNCPTDVNGNAVVNKTGLGSSAALTTSLVGALMYCHGENDDNEDNANKDEDDEDEDNSHDGNTKIHNLAQICHCHAQGKVGSGFDVSAAMHGTHVYKRFPKCLLSDLLQQLDHAGRVGGGREELVKLVQLTWKDDMVTPIQMPSGQLQIVLADVCGGSESPSMASAVLRWKQTQTARPVPHWDDLKELNGRVVELMQSLMTSSSSAAAASDETKTKTAIIDYDARSQQLATDWPIDCPLKALHDTFLSIRQHLKQMGDKAGVPIEPDEQTKLCDATLQVPGVICAVVPGAGGYDAVACLYIDRPHVLAAIGQIWADWEDPIICPLGVQLAEKGLEASMMAGPGQNP